MSEGNKEELTLIRLLIEQNGETLQMMRSLMKREDDDRAGERERWMEYIGIVKTTGALDAAIQHFVKKMREPRLVKPHPEEKCRKCDGEFGPPKLQRAFYETKDGVKTKVSEECLVYTCGDCGFSKTGPTVDQKAKVHEAKNAEGTS